MINDNAFYRRRDFNSNIRYLIPLYVRYKYIPVEFKQRQSVNNEMKIYYFIVLYKTAIKFVNQIFVYNFNLFFFFLPVRRLC